MPRREEDGPVALADVHEREAAGRERVAAALRQLDAA